MREGHAVTDASEFRDLRELKLGKRYAFSAISGGADIEGSFMVFREGDHPIIHFRSSNAPAGSALSRGAATIQLIGWVLDIDSFLGSIAPSVFGHVTSHDFGSNNLLGLLLNGAPDTPQPVFLGCNPSIVASPRVGDAT